MRRFLLSLILLSLAPLGAQATVFMSQQQALSSAFSGAKIERQTFYLTREQIETVRRQSGGEAPSGLAVRYVASRKEGIVGYAYFDSHRVRTQAETVMVIVLPDNSVERVDILSFNEPAEYLPKRRWIDQFRRRKFSERLSLTGDIRPISGATLSGRAIVTATRRVLALHQLLQETSTSSK